MAEENITNLHEYKARKLVSEGLQKVRKGQIQKALQDFKISVETFPTGEAYTYWAWMVSSFGDWDQAIHLCSKAIEVDPLYGNPYNDIGMYLLKKGELEMAVPWFEKAKVAPRYETRHYPHINLGRIYLSQCDFRKALTEFEEALKHDPLNAELQNVAGYIRRKYGCSERGQGA